MGPKTEEIRLASSLQPSALAECLNEFTLRKDEIVQQFNATQQRIKRSQRINFLRQELERTRALPASGDRSARIADIKAEIKLHDEAIESAAVPAATAVAAAGGAATDGAAAAIAAAVPPLPPVGVIQNSCTTLISELKEKCEVMDQNDAPADVLGKFAAVWSDLEALDFRIAQENELLLGLFAVNEQEEGDDDDDDDDVSTLDGDNSTIVI